MIRFKWQQFIFFSLSTIFEMKSVLGCSNSKNNKFHVKFHFQFSLSWIKMATEIQFKMKSIAFCYFELKIMNAVKCSMFFSFILSMWMWTQYYNICRSIFFRNVLYFKFFNTIFVNMRKAVNKIPTICTSFCVFSYPLYSFFVAHDMDY